MKAERLVLDTNVLVSALLLRSPTPAAVVENLIERGRLVVTEATQRELVAALTSPKFDKFVPQAQRQELLLQIAPITEPVIVLQLVRVCRDPQDDFVLEAALNGSAEAIVSGDKDLLALDPFRGIPILTPLQYLRLLSARDDDATGR